MEIVHSYISLPMGTSAAVKMPEILGRFPTPKDWFDGLTNSPAGFLDESTGTFYL